ncbi:hypothetical protein ANCDUO_16683, partial [Ancylostoma duodenale]
CAFVRPGMAGFTHRSRRGSGDSNYSHREDDLELEAGNRETLRRDAERQAALQLERAKHLESLRMIYDPPKFWKMASTINQPGIVHA